MKDFSTDKDIRGAVRELTQDEFAALEENIVNDGKCYESLKVWKEKNVLLDGHHRHKICKKHGIKFTVEYVSFPSKQDAILWVQGMHYGRRNLTATEQAYIRGKRYEAEKQEQGGDRKSEKSKSQNETLKTAERLASEFKVDRSTINRDAVFSKQVDELADALGEKAKTQILSGESSVPKSKLPELVELAKTAPAKAKEVLNGTTKMKSAPPPKGYVSKLFCDWLELIRMKLDGTKVQFGSLRNMMNDPGWDHFDDDYIGNMLDSLPGTLEELRKEFEDVQRERKRDRASMASVP